MNDMERRKFEDSFQDAFRDAEMNPSAEVWTNIELDLEKAEGGKMKRRLLFYKLLAAASVAFAMCVAGVGYYVMNDQSINSHLALQEETGRNSITSKGPDKTDAASSVVESPSEEGSVSDIRSSSSEQSSSTQYTESSDNQRAEKIQQGSNHVAQAESGLQKTNEHRPTVAEQRTVSAGRPSTANGSKNESNVGVTNQTSSAAAGNGDNGSGHSQLPPFDNTGALTGNENSSSAFIGQNNTGRRPLPTLHKAKEPVLEFPGSNADPGLLLLARLDDEARRYEDNDKKSTRSASEKLWTSVGVAAGSFNANNPSVAPQQSNFLLQATNAQNTATKQSKASGLAYSIGVSMGTHISDRWVLQGGVNYMTQSSDYTANSVVVVDNNFASPQAESMNTLSPRLEKSADTKVAQTFPYNVNNQVRFVSVPLQAGYMLVNRKVGFQLNAGVSTDFFLENSINPDGGGVASTTVGRGAESPYRSLNFSGLMGTELSYKVGNHYRLSLNPGIRYPFSSIYKESTGVDANPVTFDIGLRFRYIFN